MCLIKQQLIKCRVQIADAFRIFEKIVLFRTIDLQQESRENDYDYYPFQKIRQLGRILITFDRKVIETCGFHHLKEDTGAHRYDSKFDWLSIHQSGECSLDIFTIKYLAHFLINFESESDHTIEKTVLFRSTQGRPFQLVSFKSYKSFPETPDFSQLTLDQFQNHMGWGNSSC